ncbi:hypothetical protein D043_0912A, partial [Vibrio parahaemolyticus EKP-021]
MRLTKRFPPPLISPLPSR